MTSTIVPKEIYQIPEHRGLRGRIITVVPFFGSPGWNSRIN